MKVKKNAKMRRDCYLPTIFRQDLRRHQSLGESWLPSWMPWNF